MPHSYDMLYTYLSSRYYGLIMINDIEFLRYLPFSSFPSTFPNISLFRISSFWLGLYILNLLSLFTVSLYIVLSKFQFADLGSGKPSVSPLKGSRLKALVTKCDIINHNPPVSAYLVMRVCRRGGVERSQIVFSRIFWDSFLNIITFWKVYKNVYIIIRTEYQYLWRNHRNEYLATWSLKASYKIWSVAKKKNVLYIPTYFKYNSIREKLDGPVGSVGR